MVGEGGDENDATEARQTRALEAAVGVSRQHTGDARDGEIYPAVLSMRRRAEYFALSGGLSIIRRVALWRRWRRAR